ncbi:PAS domain S-box protein [bacterium]|nr:PAS domain S-box protein [bacterium]
MQADISQDENLLLRQRSAELERQLASLQQQHAAVLTQLQLEIDARQRAEAALRSHEAEVRALFRAMQDVILVLDAEGRHLKVIPTNAPFLWRSPVELLGKTIRELFPSASADYFLHTIQQVLTTGKPAKVAYSLGNADEEIWLEANIAPLSKNTVVWVAKDNTEHKRAEEELKRSEARFRSYFELPLIGIAITSPEKRVGGSE